MDKEIRVNQEEMERAILWAERHWAFVEWLCQNQDLTDERIEELKIEARKRGIISLKYFCV